MRVRINFSMGCKAPLNLGSDCQSLLAKASGWNRLCIWTFANCRAGISGELIRWHPEKLEIRTQDSLGFSRPKSHTVRFYHIFADTLRVQTFKLRYTATQTSRRTRYWSTKIGKKHHGATAPLRFHASKLGSKMSPSELNMSTLLWSCVAKWCQLIFIFSGSRFGQRSFKPLPVLAKGSSEFISHLQCSMT